MRVERQVAIDIEKIRRDFPFLETCLYLNTAAAGIAPSGAGAAASRFFDCMMSRGYEGVDDWRAVASSVQTRIAALAGVASADVGFAASTTEAVNLVAQALPIRPGDRVVLAADEFPSVGLALGGLVSRGVRLVEVPIVDEQARTDLLCDAAAGARYLGVSHVHWQTGTKVDLSRLSAACRSSGCALIVDGIQALGATPVDASKADAYVAAVFKWLLSGFGLAVVITRPGFRETLNPAFRGYFNPPPSRELRSSHLNYAGLCVLDDTLARLEALGWSEIFGRVAMLVERLRQRLDGAGLRIITPDGAAAGIVGVECEVAEDVVAKLKRRGVSVEARGGAIRVSPHFYNTEEEIGRFCGILLDIMEETACRSPNG
jgi:selenocysteine lyase/cysteine desulfurase